MESALLSPTLDGRAIRPTQTLTHTRHPLRRRNVELTQKRKGTLQGGGKVFSATIVRGGSPARYCRVSRGPRFRSACCRDRIDVRRPFQCLQRLLQLLVAAGGRFEIWLFALLLFLGYRQLELKYPMV